MKKSTKPNVATLITNQIIEALNSGVVAWQKEWNGIPAYNYESGKAYSILNQLLLPKSGAWLTFNQAKKLGGNVKSGSKSSMVAFFSFYDKKVTVENLKTKKEEVIVETKSCLKYYRVFHNSDIDGIDFKEKEITLFDNSEIKESQEIADYYFSSNASFITELGSDRAYYSASKDVVVMPDLAQFKSSESYYATLFHEMTHSTGHRTRLARDLSGKFGSKSYAKEELVAEIGSAMLCSFTNIDSKEVFENSAAYIDNWIKALENDHNLIVHASARAEKAVNLIIGDKANQEDIAA
jgi:antirestriction protein ArdC